MPASHRVRGRRANTPKPVCIPKNKNEYKIRAERGKTHDMPVACCLDIETTGLDKATSMITVISMALYDTSRKRTIEEFCFNVCLTREESLDNEKDLKLKVRTIMNGADALVAYNGISFDLPFLAHWIDNLIMDMLLAWKQKTVDFLHEAKIRIHSFISMDHVASLNQITLSKIATGKQAIVWAKERKW